MGKLDGRTAIVTGGSRGIGRAVCLKFAREGANVAINYTSNEAQAQEVAAAARAAGVKAQIYKANVADEGEVNAMCQKAIGDFGQIDILINNAGLGSSHVNRPTITEATTAKAGVEALAHTLAKEERANGMRVNIIAPGLVDTDMGRKLLATMGVNADMSQRAAQSPFGMVCTPDDIASAMLFLCSEDGRYITNERVTVSGGGF